MVSWAGPKAGRTTASRPVAAEWPTQAGGLRKLTRRRREIALEGLSVRGAPVNVTRARFVRASGEAGGRGRDDLPSL